MTVATLAGVPVRLHWSFVVLVVGLSGWTALTVGVGELPSLLAALVALFGSVLVHELGHAAMARRLGIRTREIMLLPIGGAARMERLTSPLDDLLVSLAGPGVSLVLGGLLLVVGVLFEARGPALLGVLNLFLGALNLVPAYPMDGGRVLRAALAPRVGARRAWTWTMRVGGALAIGFVAVGAVLREPSFAVLGLVLVVMQRQEQRVLGAIWGRDPG